MTSDAALPGGAVAPSWTGIRDEVLGRIRDRTYPPGALIPTETELAAEFGCARATVSRALRELAESGLLDRRRKAGTRVAAEPVRKATMTIPLIRRQIEAAGMAYDFIVTHHSVEPLPDALADRLGPMSQALHLTTLHRGDGQPRVHEDRWINPQAVPDLADADLAAISVNEWLVRNVPYTAGELRIEAVAAGPFGDLLACAPEAAVLRLTRVTWSGADWITHVRQTHAPGLMLDSTL